MAVQRRVLSHPLAEKFFIGCAHTRRNASSTRRDSKERVGEKKKNGAWMQSRNFSLSQSSWAEPSSALSWLTHFVTRFPYPPPHRLQKVHSNVSQWENMAEKKLLAAQLLINRKGGGGYMIIFLFFEVFLQISWKALPAQKDQKHSRSSTGRRRWGHDFWGQYPWLSADGRASSHE